MKTTPPEKEAPKPVPKPKSPTKNSSKIHPPDDHDPEAQYENKDES
jgi:hypothetical protein